MYDTVVKYPYSAPSIIKWRNPKTDFSELTKFIWSMALRATLRETPLMKVETT